MNYIIQSYAQNTIIIIKQLLLIDIRRYYLGGRLSAQVKDTGPWEMMTDLERNCLEPYIFRILRP